jgi:hypothetical protein
MTWLKFQISNPKSQINSKLQSRITKTTYLFPSPFDACLPQAGGRVRVGVMDGI